MQRVTLQRKDDGTQVTGELVLDLLAHWQVAVNGTVVAFSKDEYERAVDLSFGGLFGDLFDPR